LSQPKGIYFFKLYSIRKFFIRNGIDATEEEVRSSFKRLDIDRDARVTFSEFKRLFSNGEAVSNSNGFKSSGSTIYDSKSNSKGFTESPLKAQTLRSPRRSPLRTTLRSPIRTTSQRFYSPLRYTSPLRDRTMSVLEMSNERINRSFARSPEVLKNSTNLLNSSLNSSMRSSNVRLGSSTNNLCGTNTYTSFEEENFISYLRELLDLENQLEKAKCDTIIKSDFNGEDAFGIFEIERRGYVTDLDLKYGFNSLGIYPTQDEIALLIKRYDNRGEGILT
jgi:Ca2+-binding EF-hand superfamily protein